MQSAPKVNILLVDDKPENLLALETTLADLGHNLVAASSGAEALRWILREEFAVILLDVQMPGVDGFETAELIRRRERNRHTPIMFLTAASRSEPEVFKGYSVGAVDYLVKPFVPKILRSKVAVFVELFQVREQLRQQAETLAAANRELAAANAELDAFSSSASHDLRSPLRHIAQYVEALREDCTSRLEADGRRYLGRIEAAVGRMGELIEDLLKLARVTRAEIRRQPVGLSSLASAIAAELKHGESNRRVEFLIAHGLTAIGDAQLLRLALENLLGNAWKFTGKREPARIEFGALGIEDIRLQIGDVPKALVQSEISNLKSAIYYVRDNGVGFDPALAKKLFAPFQRLHTTAEFPGTGIGLATVQRIIQRHGGRVWAEAEVGKGATFYFTLG